MMKLYFAPNTRAERTAWLLNELGLDYELERYKLGDKAMRSPEWGGAFGATGRLSGFSCLPAVAALCRGYADGADRQLRR